MNFAHQRRFNERPRSFPKERTVEREDVDSNRLPFHVVFEDDRSIETTDGVRRARLERRIFSISPINNRRVFFQNDSSMHRGKSFETCGGVGRNIANALMNLGLNPTPLISVVGDDDPGKAIIKSLGNGGQTVDRLSNTSTPRYAYLSPESTTGSVSPCFNDAAFTVNFPRTKLSLYL